MSILRVACLGVALAAVWAYFAELASREVLISIFFASLIGALFLGSAKKGKSSKGSASEDESDDEDFKEIGLDIAKENIIPSGSRRSTKVCPTYPSPSNPLVSGSSPPRPLVHSSTSPFRNFPTPPRTRDGRRTTRQGTRRIENPMFRSGSSRSPLTSSHRCSCPRSTGRSL